MYRMKSNQRQRSGMIRRKSVLLTVPLALVLTFVLAACGTNPGTGAGSGTTPTTGPVKVVGSGAPYGCPNGTPANPPQGTPNVIVQFKNSNSTITAHTGDIIEVRLPFGQSWQGPTTSQGVLQLQSIPGYTAMAEKACVWRFVAAGTGTTQLNFIGRPICKKGQMCPMYILRVPFTFDVR